MDPQSQSFTPYSSNHDTWRLQTDVVRMQQVQQEHAERIVRLERRQDEDARVKSVWGNSSPFPSVLSGTPQQAPLQHPTSDHFRNFDDEANTLISSLHLDAEDEPRRGMSANSRANSVRFDETANQNHFSHSSRPSVEILSRTSSGLGGVQMNERSSSYKSDGRASSVHSARSAASGLANSLNLETAYSVGDSTRSPSHTPGLAPGLLLLGSAPAIIRCWMNTNFKHDALLYAAVCTGSFRSSLNLSLIRKLGFEENIMSHTSGFRTIELPVYFPEAVPYPASSRSSSPAPQLPTLSVDFQVAEEDPGDDKAIQIVLGSDTLRAHSADILFSSSSMTLFDDERSKLSIPLVRPESEAAFNSLVTSSNMLASDFHKRKIDEEQKRLPYLNGLGHEGTSSSTAPATAGSPSGRYRPPNVIAADSDPIPSVKAGSSGSDVDTRPTSRQSVSTRPALSLINTRSETEESSDAPSQSAPMRSDSTPVIWNNWRRDGASATAAAQQLNTLDWAGASKNRETHYQRKETGIKVLKPKTASRTVSSSATPNTSMAGNGGESKSRFFDEGRRRSETNSQSSVTERKEDETNSSISATSASQMSTNTSASTTAPSATTPKTKTNPIGGGSAFSWLNSGGK